jgi:hypothetical protein
MLQILLFGQERLVKHHRKKGFVFHAVAETPHPPKLAEASRRIAQLWQLAQLSAAREGKDHQQARGRGLRRYITSPRNVIRLLLFSCPNWLAYYFWGPPLLQRHFGGNPLLPSVWLWASPLLFTDPRSVLSPILWAALYSISQLHWAGAHLWQGRTDRCIMKTLTNSTASSRPWTVDSYLVAREISCYWNPKGHCRHQKSPSLDHHLKRFNLVI